MMIKRGFIMRVMYNKDRCKKTDRTFYYKMLITTDKGE